MALSTNHKSIATVVLSLLLTGALAVPAFADDKGPADVFPMKAAEFQQKVEDRIAKHKAHLEERITNDKVDATKAKEMRDRFDAHTAQVRAALATAVQDGVVTKEEAQAVRAAGGGHGHHRGDAQK
ncbi:hypothetical protein LVJ94_24055 [Pendulispora rubella]|uniref:Uncharacterized protein n=1 Tax=Pendulispora rubella TaxID=2741070 RepID=A0ABZ2LMB0_9BACT